MSNLVKKKQKTFFFVHDAADLITTGANLLINSFLAVFHNKPDHVHSQNSHRIAQADQCLCLCYTGSTISVLLNTDFLASYHLLRLHSLISVRNSKTGFLVSLLKLLLQSHSDELQTHCIAFFPFTYS